MARKLYEVEIQRRDITPKQFFRYCKREMQKRAGVELNTWIDNYDDFENPLQPCDCKWNYEEYEKRTIEICKILPFEYQMFLSNAYNFIMEFQFHANGKGVGYMYAMEFER